MNVWLKETPFEKLRAHEGCVYHWNERDRYGTLGVTVVPVDDDTLRVIVQGDLPARFLPSVLHPILDGFNKHRDGTVERVAYEDISHYD